jgi:hypothetical protein
MILVIKIIKKEIVDGEIINKIIKIKNLKMMMVGEVISNKKNQKIMDGVSPITMDGDKKIMDGEMNLKIKKTINKMMVGEVISNKKNQKIMDGVSLIVMDGEMSLKLKKIIKKMMMVGEAFLEINKTKKFPKCNQQIMVGETNLI